MSTALSADLPADFATPAAPAAQRRPGQSATLPASANRPALCLVRPGGQWVQRSEPILGSLFRVEVWCGQRSRGEAAVAAVLHEMRRIDRVVSPYLPGGALGTTRREASWRPAALAPELTQLIETAMQWAQHCQAAFDPQATDRSPQAGMQLDLRACARAHAVDRCMAVLHERCVAQARVVSGTAQGVIGPARDASGGLWKACLGPDYELELTRGTLVSHADGLFSAAVLGGSALIGEALSRGLLHLGVQRGLDLLRRWPELQTLMVDATGTVQASPGLRFSRSAGSQGRWLDANAAERWSGELLKR